MALEYFLLGVVVGMGSAGRAFGGYALRLEHRLTLIEAKLGISHSPEVNS